LFYSTPSSQKVYATCKDQKKYHEQLLTVEGMGSINLQPDCTLLLNDKNRHKTPANVFTMDLPKSKIFDILNQFPNLTETNAKFIYKTVQFSDVPHLNFTPIAQFNVEDFFKETFDYKNQFKVLSPVILFILLFIFSMILCCCCCKPARQYCTTLWLCRPHNTWMGNVNNFAQRRGCLARMLRRWFVKAETSDRSYNGGRPAPANPATSHPVATAKRSLYPSLPVVRYLFPNSSQPEVQQNIPLDSVLSTPSTTTPTTTTSTTPPTTATTTPSVRIKEQIAEATNAIYQETRRYPLPKDDTSSSSSSNDFVPPYISDLQYLEALQDLKKDLGIQATPTSTSAPPSFPWSPTTPTSYRLGPNRLMRHSSSEDEAIQTQPPKRVSFHPSENERQPQRDLSGIKQPQW